MIYITKIQQQYVDFLKSFVKENGYPPSVQDFADNFEVNVNASYDHINALKKKGVFESSPGVARSLRIAKGARYRAKSSHLDK